MSNFSKINRRSVMVLVAGALLAGVTTASAGGGNASPVRSGIYVGQWKDGTKLKEQVVFGNGYIRLIRFAKGSPVGKPSYFRPIGGNVYRNFKSGSTITLETRRRFVWRNRYKLNSVTYKWKR